MQIKCTFINRKSTWFRIEEFIIFYCDEDDCLQQLEANSTRRTEFADDPQLTLQAENEHPCNPEFRVIKLHHDSQCASNFEHGASTFMKPQLHLQFLRRQVPAFTRRTAVTLFSFYAP